MNPFQLVLNEIWEMLLAHPAFIRDVKEGNRIRFDDLNDRDPVKENVQAADLPEVVVSPATGSANVMSTSSSSQITRTYNVMISTGDYRYTEILAVVEWYVWCSFVGWKERLSALTWRDQRFVKKVNVLSVADGLSDPNLNRNIVGWSAVWAVEVEMHFRTQDQLDELRTIHEEAN